MLVFIPGALHFAVPQDARSGGRAVLSSPYLPKCPIVLFGAMAFSPC